MFPGHLQSLEPRIVLGNQGDVQRLLRALFALPPQETGMMGMSNWIHQPRNSQTLIVLENTMPFLGAQARPTKKERPLKWSRQQVPRKQKIPNRSRKTFLILCRCEWWNGFRFGVAHRMPLHRQVLDGPEGLFPRMPVIVPHRKPSRQGIVVRRARRDIRKILADLSTSKHPMEFARLPVTRIIANRLRWS